MGVQDNNILRKSATPKEQDEWFNNNILGSFLVRYRNRQGQRLRTRQRVSRLVCQKELRMLYFSVDLLERGSRIRGWFVYCRRAEGSYK